MHTLSGIVQKGKKRGKRLGFPTANIPLTKPIPEGIYISTTTVDDKTFPSLTFIGASKTFGERTIQAETFLLDFHKDLYGKLLLVRLLKKIRENKKFDSVEQLVMQMEQDKLEAHAYFTKKKHEIRVG